MQHEEERLFMVLGRGGSLANATPEAFTLAIESKERELGLRY